MFDLRTLFRKKPSDFLSNVKAADEWLHTLRQEDEYEAQKQVIDALASFLKSQDPLTKERLKVLMHLDETSQVFQKKLGETYLHHQRELRRAEDALWKSMTTLYAQLAHSYQLFIHKIVAQRGKSEFSRYLPTIAARTLHYYAQGIKWNYFHQEPVQPVMWKRMHKYYLMCESSHFAKIGRASCRERVSIDV